MEKCFFCKKDVIDQADHIDCATSASVISLREPDFSPDSKSDDLPFFEESSSKGKEKAGAEEDNNNPNDNSNFYFEIVRKELTTNLESIKVNLNYEIAPKLEKLETSQNSQKQELEKIKTETGEIKGLVEKNKTKITDLIQSLAEKQKGEKSENLKNTIANELKNTNEEIKKLINEKHLEIEKKLATIITKISSVDSQIQNIDSKLNEQKTQIEKSLRTNKKMVVCVVIFSLLLVIGNLLFPRKKENKNSLTS
jgi:chromosome segregation ATPase